MAQGGLELNIIFSLKAGKLRQKGRPFRQVLFCRGTECVWSTILYKDCYGQEEENGLAVGKIMLLRRRRDDDGNGSVAGHMHVNLC